MDTTPDWVYVRFGKHDETMDDCFKVQCVLPWWKNEVEQDGVDWRKPGSFFWGGRGLFHEKHVELYM